MSAQTAYNYEVIQQERLDRGLIALRDGDSLAISWRRLKEDGQLCSRIYIGKKCITKKPLVDKTFYKMRCPKGDLEIKLLTNRDTSSLTLPKAATLPYLPVPLTKPEDGVTPDGHTYQYSANDCSVGDVDGDGRYELIVKWDPSNSHDNSHEGFTGNVLLDCYKIGTAEPFMWRIDLGRNIRAGAHYTQFMVYDFDGDGRSEIICKTADGTIDGRGTVIGDSTLDHRFDGYIEKNIAGKHSNGKQRVTGRILSGNEYLTVFRGTDGSALSTVPYLPPRGEIASWGDAYGNRSDRYLACVAYLDGVHPSVVMCRGYYTKSYLAAYDFDGKELKLRWMFDSEKTDHENHDAISNGSAKPYSGQGNHNLRVADVDADGCDEITYGSMAIDHDGTGLYSTGFGHGDAIHLMPFIPCSDRLQVWDVHENKRDGSELRDAATGEVILQIPSTSDVGRAMAADIDPTNPGIEMWSASQKGYFDYKGIPHNTDTWIPQNSAIWWDGDTLRELLDKASILKYDWQTHKSNIILSFKPECDFNNGSKQNPCLSADILGDWREEVLVRTTDSREIRIYSTSIPTSYSFPCLMQDIPYRLSVATENVGYNQPPELGKRIGRQLP